jgi:lipid-A-disaccharide synthase
MHIFLSVGEPSGDQHAAELIEELRWRVPRVRVTGFGGPLMEQQGCERLYPLTDLAVMGFFRIIPLLLTFYRLVRQAEAFLARERPDAVILVDCPGFNWWIARKARKHGIPVFYYLPPQLWAWAPWRVRKMRRFVDHVISGLSFEVEWYRKRGIACEFVGHPFFDEVARHELDRGRVEQLQEHGGGMIGLLPGSRDQEVRHNFPIMLEVAARIADEHPAVRFAVACYRESQLQTCRRMLEAALRAHPTLQQARIELELGRTPEIIEAADCCLMVSGSVSLELLARRTPGVVVYRTAWWMLVLRAIFVTCRFITLPNLMAGRQIMPEFVFAGGRARRVREMAAILGRWICDDLERQRIADDLDDLAGEVACTGGTSRTADFVLGQLNGETLRKAA